MSSNPNTAVASGQMEQKNKLLFWACFAALIATSFGFIIRVLLADKWGADLHLTQIEKGQILGVGLWPFAISIIVFSLIIDKIGYGAAMMTADFAQTGTDATPKRSPSPTLYESRENTP